jgi:hypothetical protein
MVAMLVSLTTVPARSTTSMTGCGFRGSPELAEPGWTRTSRPVATWRTTMPTVSARPSMLAETVVSPFSIAVTSPEPLTVATCASALDQLGVTPGISLPPASKAWAVRVTVSPMNVRVSRCSETSTKAATC